jgi:inositol 1,4,5-triphosphate receptor type 1/inositol 1,4,5-triphosphate receptor type 3
MQTKIRHIEIVYQENKQLIFFPSHPLFDFLSEQTKDKIMFSINRET